MNDVDGLMMMDLKVGAGVVPPIGFSYAIDRYSIVKIPLK